MDERIFDHLFDPGTARNAKRYGVPYQRKVLASVPPESAGNDVEQIDWMSTKNVPLMDFVGHIETPFLMVNPEFPSFLVERHFESLMDTGKSLKFIVKKSSEYVRREIILSKIYMEDEVDWGALEATEEIPLDEKTRMYALSIDAGTIRGYLQKNPDGLKPGEKYSKALGDKIVNTLLEEEVFWGDEYDIDDVAAYKQRLIEVERIEKDILGEYRSRFPSSSIEKLAESQIRDVRSEMACSLGLTKKAEEKLAVDESNFVRRRLATCTKRCDVLDFLVKESGSSKSTVREAIERMEELGC